MKDTADGSSHDDAFGGTPPERPADPPDPEIEQKRRALNACVARHYEELMSAARTWLGRAARDRLGANAFEALAREAVHVAYLRACMPDKLAAFDPIQGDPRKWLFRFVHFVTRERRTQRARERRHHTNAKRATVTPISHLATTDQQRLSQDELLSLQSRLDGSAEDHIPDDVRAALAGSDVDRLLPSISIREADLLKRRHVEGMTYEEIAAETGEKPSTLRKQAERARKKLRALDGGPAA